jgi:hypothetical protein
MIEAKDKEQAVLHLYRIYDLYPVIHGASFVSPYYMSQLRLLTTICSISSTTGSAGG